MMETYRIVVADDHAPLRHGLKMMLANWSEYEVTGEACDGPELLALLEQGCVPDVLILDISMPGLRGIELIREIRGMSLDLRVLVLTMHREEDLLCQAFVAGADGYLLKEELPKELFVALKAVLGFEAYVSPLMAQELRDGWLKVFIATKGTPPPEGFSVRTADLVKYAKEKGRASIIV